MLAKQIGTNRLKLNQGFHHLYNTTPFGYLRNYRLRQAKSLLMTSELSVEDDYFVSDASTATRTDTSIRNIPQSIQVIPR